MQLGWIDFSKEDREKVLDVIHLLQEPGAVDELGIGIIRDAFANVFFPGTSTVQTRAKYFLIVPYLLKEAGDGKFGSDLNKVIKTIDNEEMKCGLKLIEGVKDGVIGQNNLPHSWVARTPSNIYWNGIKTYGIFKDNDLSIKDYLKETIVLKKLKKNKELGNRADGAEENERDDKDAGDISFFDFWELSDVYSEDWRDELVIDLSQEEAVFLERQIIKSQSSSLMAYLIKNHIPLKQFMDFESLSNYVYEDVSESMKELIRLANAFNGLVYLARIRYNLILSDGNNKDAVDEWEFYSGDISKMADVDLARIYELLRIRNVPTKKFLNELKAAFLAKDFDLVDELIIKREIKLKSASRAKLARKAEYSDSEWIGGGWLDYRFNSAKRIIADIYQGEGIEDV